MQARELDQEWAGRPLTPVGMVPAPGSGREVSWDGEKVGGSRCGNLAVQGSAVKRLCPEAAGPGWFPLESWWMDGVWVCLISWAPSSPSPRLGIASAMWQGALEQRACGVTDLPGPITLGFCVPRVFVIAYECRDCTWTGEAATCQAVSRISQVWEVELCPQKDLLKS